jgi:predicted component of type VI protein secretion system
MVASIRLVLNSGPTPGKTYPLEKSEIFIGRDLANDIVINDPEVSRRHARLSNQGNQYIIEDLGSTNGTSVNGQRLTGPYMLRPGEQITFGERVNLAVEAITPPPDAVPAGAQAQPPSAYPAPASQEQPIYPQTVPPPLQQAYPSAASSQGNPPAQQPYAYPSQPAQQQSYPMPSGGYTGQPTYQAPAMQPMDVMQQAPFSGQVPTPPYQEEPVIQYRIPVWMFILIAVLLLVIMILVIDDFNLWPVLGL